MKPNIKIPPRRVSLDKSEGDIKEDAKANDLIQKAFEQRKAEWQRNA